MSVCWHAEEPGKLLVAEKRGTITVFNVERKQAILSFDADCGPLTAADWSTCNSLRVAALVDGHLLVWDTTRARYSLICYYCFPTALHSTVLPYSALFLFFFEDALI